MNWTGFFRGTTKLRSLSTYADKLPHDPLNAVDCIRPYAFSFRTAAPIVKFTAGERLSLIHI